MKHVHKYKRIEFVKTLIEKDSEGKRVIKRTKKYAYKCMIPGCSTFKDVALMEGEISICWKCGEQLVINKVHLQRNGVVHPLHSECKDFTKSIRMMNAREAKNAHV